MGNMLESDSSGSSDLEVENNDVVSQTRIRTAGDGMESGVSSNKGGLNSSVDGRMVLIEGSAVAENSSSHKTDYINPQIVTVIESEKSAIENTGNISRSSSANSFTSKTMLRSTGIKIASKSPTQLPSKNLLIPVKLVRCKPNVDKSSSSSSSYDKFTAVGAAGKQKNPKFVPYEPYTCAIRSMTDPGHNKLRTRKASDASSVASQSSTLSIVDRPVSDTGKVKSTSNQLETSEMNSSAPNSVPNMKTKIKREPENSNCQNSAALMKERLKMVEKEVNELQTENSRLKRMLVDSLAGTPTQTASIMNKNLANGNAHRISESFDNLNDEIEVWRSKFLSSCVLVEQLNKDNQIFSGSVQSAAEILTDLKHSLSLTPRQYDNVNEWFRQAKPLIRTVQLQDTNFNDEALADKE